MFGFLAQVIAYIGMIWILLSPKNGLIARGLRRFSFWLGTHMGARWRGSFGKEMLDKGIYRVSEWRRKRSLKDKE